MNKYYRGFTDPIKRYQKSEKYKSYRRKYEAVYRDDNRIEWNYKSWKSMKKKAGINISMLEELNYLAQRIYNEL